MMNKKKKANPLELSDKAFFQAFYEEHIRFLYYLARKYAPNSDECDDLVQDTIVRLMNNTAVLRQIDRCKAAKYIDLTIRTAYLDRERHRKKERIIFLDDKSLEKLMIERLLPEDIDQELSASLAVEKLKRELPARDWIVLEGKHFLGLSHEELSALVDSTPDSVRMLLHRAKEKAKAILAENDGKGGDTHE